MNRPCYWRERIAIGLACVGAVLLLSLSGCDRETPEQSAAWLRSDDDYQFRWCASACAPHAVAAFAPGGGRCFCAAAYADGGHP